MASILACSGHAILMALLSRPPRRTEGLLIAYFLPALAFFGLRHLARQDCNYRYCFSEHHTASGAQIARATGSPIGISERVAEIRKERGRFSSLSQVPSLGRASGADRADLARLASRRTGKPSD